MTMATHEVSPFLQKITEEICLRDTFSHKICQHWKDLTKMMSEAIDETFDKAEVGKTTDLANQVVDEITVRRMATKNDVPTTVSKKRHRRANNSDDLPLFYTDQSVGFHRGHRNTPKVPVTLAELLTSIEDEQNGKSHSMPSPSPFVLSFKDLTYSVEIKKKFNPLPCCGSSDGDDMEINTKMLLNGISGEAIEGEMMAFLGASGSGKSTPIDALADRIAKESVHEYGHIIPKNENKTEFALDLIRELEDSPEGTKSALFF
uniref:ABC transporter domain-containing protein n=1 Tax=Brassica campestris TaxID=3711 RepID=M4CFF9_BRACM